MKAHTSPGYNHTRVFKLFYRPIKIFNRRLPLNTSTEWLYFIISLISSACLISTTNTEYIVTINKKYSLTLKNNFISNKLTYLLPSF